jgi:site-specific DNA-adenine methylase
MVWERLGGVVNYVEPFFGSGAMLLARPNPSGIETVNDADGMIANFWRALQHDPDAVAFHADWPVNENDLHARHAWLVGQKETLQAQLEGDPDFYDARVAGWWVWGLCCWIGGGWCSGNGPWQSVEMEDGTRQLVHLGNAGQGVDRKRVHLSNAGRGVKRRLVHLSNAGRGVKRQLVHLGDAGQGDGLLPRTEGLYVYLAELAARLQNVRVCCGDWSRVCGPTPTVKQGLTGVFLDPPYSAEAERDMGIYSHDSGDVAHAAREWAIKNGDDPRLRIAFCGYEGEHEFPASWIAHRWHAGGGYASQGNGATKGKGNKKRECVWFSPHCLRSGLFEDDRGEEALL